MPAERARRDGYCAWVRWGNPLTAPELPAGWQAGGSAPESADPAGRRLAWPERAAPRGRRSGGFAVPLPRPRHSTLGRRDGLTLIELLFVMAILGILTAIGIPKLLVTIDDVKVARATADIRVLETDIDGQEQLPASLAAIGRANLRDPWGRPYVYAPLVGNGARGARKDRFLVPLNSTYDLYSMGKDGASSSALTARASHDDIVRADDGSYIGLASKF